MNVATGTDQKAELGTNFPYRLLLIPVAALLIAAHFLRSNSIFLFSICLISPGLLLLKRRWVPLVIGVGAAFGSLIWAQTLLKIILQRINIGQSWGLAAVILSTVILLSAVASALMRTERVLDRYQANISTAIPSAVSFLLTFTVLAAMQINIQTPLLLFERLIPGAGWVSVLGISIYAAFVTETLLDSKKQPAARRKIWLLFSAVFFAQFALGLAGFEAFTLNENIHLPIPALIVAGPLYRGEGLFMLGLFLATVLLVGPGWCSHLCYVGSWDNYAADVSTKQNRPPKSVFLGLKTLLFISTISVALILKSLAVSTTYAAVTALIFGMTGLAVMGWISRRSGYMAHCTIFCPVGLCANLLGKISPFRICISDACTKCGKCAEACRYGALTDTDINKKRPGLTCSLCGDCVGACSKSNIGYRFLRFSNERSRVIYLVTIVVLHAVFLGVARI